MDLGSDHEIHDITINNRAVYHQDHLDKFKITYYDNDRNVLSTYHYGTDTLPVNTTGLGPVADNWSYVHYVPNVRYVRIEKDTNQLSYLALGEVSLNGRKMTTLPDVNNVALHKTVTRSTTQNYGPSDNGRAVDGNPSTNVYTYRDSVLWFQVDLEGDYNLTHVNVEFGKWGLEYIGDFTVEYYTANQTPGTSTPEAVGQWKGRTSGAGVVDTVPLVGQNIRYVRVKGSRYGGGTTHMKIRELQVMGIPDVSGTPVIEVADVSDVTIVSGQNFNELLGVSCSYPPSSPYNCTADVVVTVTDEYGNEVVGGLGVNTPAGIYTLTYNYTGPNEEAATKVLRTVTITVVTGFAEFDNQSDVLKTENVAGIALGTDYTLSSSFVELSPNGAWRTLFRGPSNDHQIILRQTDGMLGMYLNNEGGFKSSGYNAMVLNDGQPHTISAVASGGTTTFYVDGSQVGSVAHKSTAAILAIGNYQGGTQRFSNLLDNVQIHANRALSPTEVLQIAADEQVADGLTAYYDFEGTSLAEQLEDKSGNGNSLTSTGVTIFY